MAIYLVLVRHGQAEDLVTTDETRHLTEAGVRALEATLPDTLAMLPAGCEVRLWSSGLDRAYETAQVVSRCLGDVPIEVKQHLAVGDYTMFAFELEAVTGASLRSNDEASSLGIIVVGHEPMMGELAQRYCGADLPVGKGAVVCIRLASEADRLADPEVKLGRLLWFVQGAEAKRWQVLIDIEKVLQDAYAEVCERVAEFKRDPADEEAVHQFRVSIRTLRSLVRFCEPLQNRRQNRAMQLGLRTIVRQLSRLRELDVLGETVREADGDDAPVMDAFGQTLSGAVARARMEECLGVLEALDGRRDRRVFTQLDAEFADIKWRRNVSRQGLTKADVQARFRQIAAAYEQHMAELDISDWEQTHEVRKEAKQVRYDAAKFKKLLGGETQGVVSEMKAVQEKLGDLCDARVNQGLLRDFAAAYGLSDELVAHAIELASREEMREFELSHPQASQQVSAE